MTTYVALLRGINVGGKNKLPMADLKHALEARGFENVRTLLNSGNVVFEADADATAIARRIEAAIKDGFSLSIGTLVRTQAQLQALVKSGPFKGVDVTKDTGRYITFLSEKPPVSTNTVEDDASASLRILHRGDSEVCWLVTIGTGRGTTDAMAVIEKRYGKNVTTRNWNTVEKLAAL
jgi:uncharacterized protein (DUF1697 family)